MVVFVISLFRLLSATRFSSGHETSQFVVVPVVSLVFFDLLIFHLQCIPCLSYRVQLHMSSYCFRCLQKNNIASPCRRFVTTALVFTVGLKNWHGHCSCFIPTSRKNDLRCRRHTQVRSAMFAPVRGCARDDKGIPRGKVLSYEGNVSDTTTKSRPRLNLRPYKQALRVGLP